jgi:hypothetical protein
VGTDRAMRPATQLILIAGAYALALAGGAGAVALNEMMIPPDVSQASGGMVAFGDMVLFVLVAGLLGLLPTWFLLKLALSAAPRWTLAGLLLLAAAGPASWLATAYLAGGPPVAGATGQLGAWLGVAIAFLAIPRIVLGPVVVMLEAAAMALTPNRRTRLVLGAGMLLDIVPWALFILHLVRASRY